jgi:hypothetical protein
MKEIPLTQDKVTLVDDADFDWLSSWKWYAWREPTSGLFYAHASSKIYRGNWSARPLSMSRVLMQPTNGQLVDHRDRDTLNNQRCNLRLCDRSENNLNRLHPRKGQYRGVFLVKGCPKRPFHARLSFRGVRYYGGYHATAEGAAKAYDELVNKHCPEFGLLNFGEKK